MTPQTPQIISPELEFELLQRKAKMLASATMLPGELRESLGNCAIVQQIADSMNAPAWQVASSIYFVGGRPSFKTSYLIARLNESGLLRGVLRFHYTGKPGTDSHGCIAVGVLSATGDELNGPEVTIALSKREGWFDRKGSKWQTMPDRMLAWRAASFWINLYAPQVCYGMMTTEEAHDIEIKDISPPRDTTPRESVHFKRNPKTEQFVTYDGEVINVDTETGEIADSPAFLELKKQLATIKTLSESEDLLKHPLAEKITASERVTLRGLVVQKIAEIKDGMVAAQTNKSTTAQT